MSIRNFLKSTTAKTPITNPYPAPENGDYGTLSFQAREFLSSFKKASVAETQRTQEQNVIPLENVVSSIYPYSTQVFPHAIQNLLVGFAESQGADSEGLRGDATIIMTGGVQKWAPFTIQFLMAEQEDIPDSKDIACIDREAFDVMEEFFDLLDAGAPKGVKITKPDNVSYKISCTHPQQLYDLIQDFIDSTGTETLDNALARYEPPVTKQHPELEIRSEWERRNYVDAQISQSIEKRNHDLALLRNRLKPEIFAKIEDQVLDFMPASNMPNLEIAQLSGWVMSQLSSRGGVSLEALRYAIEEDCRTKISPEFALRQYQ